MHNYRLMSDIGKIAKIIPDEFTPENLPTGVKQVANGNLNLCISIDKHYPVLGTLTKSKDTISKDSVCLIVGFQGRPNSFQLGPEWSSYDILTVSIEGDLYTCFRQSLKIIAVQDMDRDQESPVF